MTRNALAIMTGAVLAISPLGFAHQTTTSAPASAPATSQAAPAEGMTAVVDAVYGKVQVKRSADAAWENAVVGMELHEGAQIRTGFKSSIRCVIPPDQTFTLDRLGTIELTEAVKQGNLIKTDLTMKYGRAQYQIEHAGLLHDAAITSPSATLAVRGTSVQLDDSPPFRPSATSFTGRARFSAMSKTTSVGSAGGSLANMTAGEASAANTALLAGVIDPQYKGSRTVSESTFIASQTSLGAVARFDRNAGITVITGGPGPTRTEAELVTQLPGVLDFVARWTGNADVNLSVGVSKGDPATHSLADGSFHFSEYIYPGFGLNVSASGGRTDFDHRGGPNGGQEIVYWKSAPPVASYAVGVTLVSGEATDVTINAFYQGKKLPLFANQVEGSGPTFSPTLPSQTVDLGDGTTLTFLSGKSTTFTVHLAQDATNFTAPVTVYLPLGADQPLSQKPDLNNGAPADLAGPTVSPTASKNAKLSQPAKPLRRVPSKLPAFNPNPRTSK